MPTKTSVKGWLSNFKDTLEEKILDVQDKLKEAQENFDNSITDPQTKKDRKLSNFARVIEEKLDAIDNKSDEIKNKIISNDKLRTIASAVTEKLIEKADPEKDTAFKLSVGIASKLTGSLELLDNEYGETISDDKLSELANKLKNHPEFQQEGEELLSQLNSESPENFMNNELMRAHEEPLPETKKEDNQYGAEVEFGSY